jgi:hypothetical protein
LLAVGSLYSPTVLSSSSNSFPGKNEPLLASWHSPRLVLNHILEVAYFRDVADIQYELPTGFDNRDEELLLCHLVCVVSLLGPMQQ